MKSYKVFTNRGILPYQFSSYILNPFQPGIFRILNLTETRLRIESMNEHTHMFQNDFVAREFISFPYQGMNYFYYGNAVPEDKLKLFYVIDEYNKGYDVYLPDYVKEQDTLWNMDYTDNAKSLQMA